VYSILLLRVRREKPESERLKFRIIEVGLVRVGIHATTPFLLDRDGFHWGYHRVLLILGHWEHRKSPIVSLLRFHVYALNESPVAST
jgi:hypothetical protein